MSIRFFPLLLLFYTLLFGGNDAHLSLSQKGKISTDAESISFRFSKPVFAREKTGSFTYKSLLICDHGLKGAFEFTDLDKFKFYPNTPLHASTKYTCKPNPLFSGDSQSRDITFVTVPFALKEMRFFKEGIVRLEFNDGVDQTSLQKNLFLYKKRKLAKTALHYQLTCDNQKRVCLAKITEPLYGDTIEAVLHKELKNSTGKMLDKSHQTTFEEEAPAFELDSKRKAMVLFDKPHYIALPDGRLGIRFYFPGYFYKDENPLKPFVKIDGITQFSLTDVRYISYEERKAHHLHDKSETYVDIIADFKPQHTYRITLKKGLKDSYEYQLRKDLRFHVTIGDRKSALIFEEKKPYLSSQGEIGFKSVNLDAVTVIVQKIPDFNYRYFINFQKGDTQEVAQAATEVFSKQLTLANRKNRFVQHRFSLKKLTKRYKSGIFRIVMRFGNHTVEKIVYLSDIGITAKISKDQAFISLASLSATRPLAHAKVEIFSDKNALLASGESDSDGICIISQKDLALENPASVVVQTTDDRNFLVLNTPKNKAKILQKESVANKYKAWIYLQSEIIRPGNSAKMFIVLKDKMYRSAKNLPVQIHVSAPDFTTIYKAAQTCDDLGTVELSLDIPQSYKTGRYTVEVKLGKHLLGSKHFFVESFLPQQIKTEIFTDKNDFYQNEPVTGEVKSRYLFGATAAGLSVEASLTAVSKTYTPEKHEGYSFIDITKEQDNKTLYIDRVHELTLNQKGKATFYFPTKPDQPVPSILDGQIKMTLFDDGKEISAYKNVTIYPYARMAGVKILTPTLETGETLKAQTLLLDPKTGKSLKRTLQATLKKIVWHYFFDERGFYQWEKEFTEIARFQVDAGEAISRKIDAGGDYILEVADLLTGHRASQQFSVRGWDYENISPTKEIGKVQIETDDIPYAQNDTLQVKLKSPILQGRVLVTLEGEKVVFHKTLTVERGTATLDIPLDFPLGEGLYLSATVVRSSAKPATLIPYRAWGEKFIKADRSEHKLDLSVETPKIAHSNQTVTISVNCDEEAYLLVSVVDEGILQIIGQKPPHPFAFFTRTPPQHVALYDLYDQLMHYQTTGKVLEFGAGDEIAAVMARKHLAPENAAKRVKPFMYWSGLIKTDASGFATLDLTIPQFNGNAKVAAIALTKDRIGAASADLTVRDDIVLKPSYPRFLLSGDHLEIPLRFFNTTQTAQRVSLKSTTSKGVSLTRLPQTISLQPKTSKVINTVLTALSPEKGEVNITAATEQKSFLHRIELPIYTANTLQTKVYRGESKKEITLNIPKVYFSKEGAKVKITLAKTYLAQLGATLDDLIRYPYGCTEQTASQLMALFYMKSVLQNDESAYAKTLLQDRERFIGKGIRKLANLQRENGDFAYWKPYGDVNPYASLYASDVLLTLQREGFDVPQSVTEKIYNALHEIAEQGRSYEHTKYSNFDRLYAAWILSQEARLPDSVCNALYDNRIYNDKNILSLYMMAAIAKKCHMQTALQTLKQKIWKFNFATLPDYRHLGDDFYSRTRDLAFTLYLHLELFGKDKKAFTLLEKTAAHFDTLRSTQEKAFVLRAVATYYQNLKAGNIEATVTYNGDTREISKPNTFFDTLTNDTVTIDPKGKLLHYTVEVSGYLPQPVTLHKKKKKKPLRIDTAFVNQEGKNIDLNHLKRGELLYEKVTLTNIDKLDNIVVVERIPSCFEIKNERLDQTVRPKAIQNSQNFNPDYQDIRDDRLLTFIDLPAGTHFNGQNGKRNKKKPNVTTFYTPIRVTAKGTCQMPSTFCEAMYDSRIYDYSKPAVSIQVE